MGKKYFVWAAVVTQLAEQSLPTPEVHSLDLLVGEFLCRAFVYCQLYRKDEKQRPRMAHFREKKLFRKENEEEFSGT